MTRDEIYNHLAQVYLGKKSEREEKKSKQRFNAWLVINIVITGVIFASSVYGLTAFLTRRSDVLRNRVIYALNQSPIRIKYNLNYPYPPVKTFTVTVPQINVGKYKKLEFSIRGMDEGYPGTVRIELRNRKQEIASVFIREVQLDWKGITIPLEEFQEISDWSNISSISFVLESWNTEKTRGIVLIDDVCFSS